MMFETKTKIQNPKSKIGFGVLGCGWVARDYAIPGIIESKNARLVALCDLNRANYEAIAPEDESIYRTTDLNEFLAVENLDAVYIATPNDSHRFLTERCAAAGKHVLCEKPMATNYADAAARTAAGEKFDVQYATAFDQRCEQCKNQNIEGSRHSRFNLQASDITWFMTSQVLATSSSVKVG